MKKYHLKVLHSGMSFIRETIKADFYRTSDGGYHFYEKVGQYNEKELCVYPIELTIIEKIEE
jgi:hypothetical protein